jgi:hypothetical protein
MGPNNFQRFDNPSDSISDSLFCQKNLQRLLLLEHGFVPGNGSLVDNICRREKEENDRKDTGSKPDQKLSHWPHRRFLIRIVEKNRVSCPIGIELNASPFS